MGYEIFDDIVCITLEGSIDRQERVAKVFESLNIHPRFYVAKKNPRGGRVGCFESHINVIREAYNKGSQTVLIFEDDIIPTLGYTQIHLDNATTFMKNNTYWDYVQLGWGPDFEKMRPSNIYNFLTSQEVSPNIYKFAGIFTQSYALSRKGMETILLSYAKDNITTLPDEIYPHYDQYLLQILTNKYCVAPILFDQTWCQPSYNQPKTTVENILRKFTCIAESTYFFYIISLVLIYRVQILFFLLIILFSYIFTK
jgi:hypothetical protein